MSDIADYLQTARDIWPMYQDRAGADFNSELQAHVAAVLHYARSNQLWYMDAAWQLTLKVAGAAGDPAPSEMCAAGWVALAALEIYETEAKDDSAMRAMSDHRRLAFNRLIGREQSGAHTYRNN